jgi:peptidase E
MRKSGFDQVLEKMCNDGCIYVGVSAGAIVAGASVQVAAWKGWNEITGLEGLEGVDWTLQESLAGLNICSACSVFPHYSRKWETLVNQRVRELDHDCIVLSDGQGYVIDSEDRRFSGAQNGKRFGMKLHRSAHCR